MVACIYIALDGLSRKKALSLVKRLSRSRYQELIVGYKIHDLWDSYGSGFVKELKKVGARKVWVDLKLNDTPKTTALRAAAVSKSGANIISVHTSSGLRALKAAVRQNIKVVAITALTSLEGSEVKKIFGSSPLLTALRLARIAQKAGVWGIVCSPQEVKTLSQTKGLEKLTYIVPGIQTNSLQGNNQKRTGRPADALARGASIIVIGTVITQEKHPLPAFEKIAREILAIE